MPNGSSKLEIVLNDTIEELEELRLLNKTVEARIAILLRRLKNKHANPMRYE